MVHRARRMHVSANKLIKLGKWDKARELYELHLYDWNHHHDHNLLEKKEEPHVVAPDLEESECVADTYLLLALHCQRMRDIEGSRAVFREGALRFERSGESCPTCRRRASTLYQSWGLLESKLENFSLAWGLLLRAVMLDRRNYPVLRWKIFDSRFNPRIPRRAIERLDAKSLDEALTQLDTYLDLRIKRGAAPPGRRAT